MIKYVNMIEFEFEEEDFNRVSETLDEIINEIDDVDEIHIDLSGSGGKLLYLDSLLHKIRLIKRLKPSTFIQVNVVEQIISANAFFVLIGNNEKLFNNVVYSNILPPYATLHLPYYSISSSTLLNLKEKDTKRVIDEQIKLGNTIEKIVLNSFDLTKEESYELKKGRDIDISMERFKFNK